MYTIDDRSTYSLVSSSGPRWRLVTDGVMGGLSTGTVAPDRVHEVACLRLRGDVRVDNNGGFVQMALDVPDGVDAAQYAGLELALFGNSARYNVHLRTRDLHLPWQSYRSPVVAEPRWQTLRLPFEGFAAYRTATPLDPAKLRSIGLVAIGRRSMPTSASAPFACMTGIRRIICCWSKDLNVWRTRAIDYNADPCRCRDPSFNSTATPVRRALPATARR